MAQAAEAPRNPHFDQLFSQRIAALQGRGSSDERWQIWLEQEREGSRICFATDARDTCTRDECRRRTACLQLRAEWRR